jgi:hypothetical protein
VPVQLELSLRERSLLETWLPRVSQPGELQTDARSLVATGQALTATEVHDRLEKVRASLTDLRTARSTLDVSPPLGRGFTSRQPGDVILSRLSPWERAWLIVDRVRRDGGFEKPSSAAKKLEEELRTSIVNAVAIAILCLESASEGQQLARALASDASCAPDDRPWLAWLGGDHATDLAEHLPDVLVGETPKKALRAALAKQWTEAEALLPKALRKPLPKPIKPSGTRMHGQVLAQLASHALRGEPARDVVESSFATMFGFFGFDNDSDWWDGTEVLTRLPLLALYAGELAPGVPGAALLHAHRKANAHLVEPPPRAFVGPPEVVAAVEKLESVLAAAAAGRSPLQMSMTGTGNVYTVG